MKRFVVMLLAVIAIGAGAAQAQGVARIVGKTGLSPEDLAIMSENARKLYDVAAPQVGKSTDWTNPDSNAYGTTTLIGMADGCATIQQIAHPKGQDQALDIRSRVCRNAEGKWILQP
ncbi:hypothetical protein [Falsiphaeobacter marinintestinus]|uniref:hypothetical protein n=1 Tax=Falsiphaeobacter marinintestinus TaxID=1492905 RepID=UPI0011B780A9|nr:hypothetical protein [Phaeobacter marinintestinus]